MTNLEKASKLQDALKSFEIGISSSPTPDCQDELPKQIARVSVVKIPAPSPEVPGKEWGNVP